VHARVSFGQCRGDTIDETIRICAGSIVPAAKQQSGFKAAYCLVDRTTGKATSISLWGTAADMRAIEASGYLPEHVANFGAEFAGPPTTEHDEVAVQA
jgi:hypothetical protein